MVRAVGRSENLGVPVLFGGHNLQYVGLTNLPKSGGTMATPAPLGVPWQPRHPIDDRPGGATVLAIFKYLYIHF